MEEGSSQTEEPVREIEGDAGKGVQWGLALGGDRPFGAWTESDTMDGGEAVRTCARDSSGYRREGDMAMLAGNSRGVVGSEKRAQKGTVCARTGIEGSMAVFSGSQSIEVGYDAKDESWDVSSRPDTVQDMAVALFSSGSERGERGTAKEEPDGDVGLIDKGPIFCGTHCSSSLDGADGEIFGTPFELVWVRDAKDRLDVGVSLALELGVEPGADKVLAKGSASSLRVEARRRAADSDRVGRTWCVRNGSLFFFAARFDNLLCGL